MEDLKSVKISETEKNRLLIKNVNNRPNAMASFGKAKLTAEQTKDLFDKQFELVVERHNKLCDVADEHGLNIAELKKFVGAINLALDEVHAYAEEIVGGRGV